MYNKWQQMSVFMVQLATSRVQMSVGWGQMLVEGGSNDKRFCLKMLLLAIRVFSIVFAKIFSKKVQMYTQTLLDTAIYM